MKGLINRLTGGKPGTPPELSQELEAKLGKAYLGHGFVYDSITLEDVSPQEAKTLKSLAQYVDTTFRYNSKDCYVILDISSPKFRQYAENHFPTIVKLHRYNEDLANCDYHGQNKDVVVKLAHLEKEAKVKAEGNVYTLTFKNTHPKIFEDMVYIANSLNEEYGGGATIAQKQPNPSTSVIEISNPGPDFKMHLDGMLIGLDFTGCHTECCVTMHNEKVLNSVQTWLPGFSAMYHYTTFGMASFTALGAISDECNKLLKTAKAVEKTDNTYRFRFENISLETAREFGDLVSSLDDSIPLKKKGIMSAKIAEHSRNGDTHSFSAEITIDPRSPRVKKLFDDIANEVGAAGAAHEIVVDPFALKPDPGLGSQQRDRSRGG